MSSCLSQLEVFCTPSKDLIKDLTDWTSTTFHEQVSVLESTSNDLDTLHVNGFTTDQIWQQLNMQNMNQFKHVMRELKVWKKRNTGLVLMTQDDNETENEDEDDSEDSEDEEELEMDEDDNVEESEEDNVEEEDDETTIVDKKPIRDEVEDGFFDWQDMEKAAEEQEASDDEEEGGFDALYDATTLDDDEEDEEDNDDDESEEGNAEEMGHDDFYEAPTNVEKKNAISKKQNLLMEADDEEEVAERGLLSSHERRMERLQSEIQTLEGEAMGEKVWELKGEVKNAARPENSLLEATLDYDRATRVAPTITPEVTSALEDVIKARILEEDWNDVVRKLAATERKQVELMELSQEKSKEGLGEVYEKEYMKTSLGFEDTEEKKKEQDKIQLMFDNLSWKLNALSNFHFTPKPAVHEIKVQASVPAIAMEEAVPMAVSDANLKAPEEVYSKKRGREGVVQSVEEMTQEERQTTRQAKKSRRRKSRQQKEADERLVAKLNPGLGNKYEKEKMMDVLNAKNVKQGRVDNNSSSYTKSGEFFKKLQEESQKTVSEIKAGKEALAELKKSKFNAAALKL